MGTMNRFKWQRAIPLQTPTAGPGFASYELNNMKKIPTQIFTAIAGGGATAIISAYVPANSWADPKLLMIRGFYQLTLPAVAMPPTYNISEALACSQFGTVPMLNAPAFVPVAGIYTTFFQRSLIRIDPNLHAFDLGDVMQFNWANYYDANTHVIPIAATVPPFDYTSPIQIDVTVALPNTIAGATLQCLWAESFLEQALNLGRLT